MYKLEPKCAYCSAPLYRGITCRCRIKKDEVTVKRQAKIVYRATHWLSIPK